VVTLRALSLFDWWFRRAHRAPHELRHLMEVRRLYLEQVRTAARQQASIDALDRHIADVRKTLDTWSDRAVRPLPDDVRSAVMRLLGRYGDYLAVAEEIRAKSVSTLRSCSESAEWMLSTITRLGGNAARAGIDTRALAMELDVDEIQKNAENAIARALLDEGAFEPDEELVFLEKLFSSSLTPGAPRLS
jgi:hypothetical protein